MSTVLSQMGTFWLEGKLMGLSVLILIKGAGPRVTARKPDSQAAARCHAQPRGVHQPWVPICYPPILPTLLTLWKTY